MKVAELKQAIEIGRNCEEMIGQNFSAAADGSLSAMVNFPAPILAAENVASSMSGPAIKPL